MKILVTGGAGFIGSHLCERLSKEKDNEVFSIDNYSTGKESNHVDGVIYINGDTEEIDSLIEFNPDIIYHLGEYSRVEQSFEDIEKVRDFNIKGTFSVLQFCRKTRAKLVYAGSSTKFGDDGSGANQSPYAWTKSSNTQLVNNYGDWFDIDYAITYFYNVYGDREISTGKYATLIALFKEKLKKGDVLTVVNPGTQRRNFTHVNDIIDGLVLVGKKGVGDGFGIGHQDAFSILEIAKMFDGNIEMIPERKGNRMTADVITSKTEALGWKAVISVEDYIKKFVRKNGNRN
jgi:UDP-glucose 4-epimerase